MTIEEKAKRYDEALERAKSWAEGKVEVEELGASSKSVAEFIFPELKVSVDERIRKFLIQHISEWIGCIEHDLKNSSKDIESEKELAMFKAGLAYLEKQKEQKPHTDEEKEYIRTIKSIISDFIRDKKPENLAYYQRIYDWLDGRHIPFSCGHENGEPADPEAMKRNKQFDELLARVPEETKRRVDRQLSCKWLRNGDECGKGLPGTPCEIVGCVAWQHYKED